MKSTGWMTKIITTIVILGSIFVLIPANSVYAEGSATTTTSSIHEFYSTLRKSDPTLLVGIYVDNVMAVPVLQQPSTNPVYVSSRSETVTQFGIASQYGSIGLLAHNYLAGSYFSNIQSGSLISLVYGDGTTKLYKVSEIKEYQALTPNSTYSNFVDLSKPDATLSSTDLFNDTYGLGNVLVLQTCIYQNGDPSWGRLFVIATPFNLKAEASIQIEVSNQYNRFPAPSAES